jgi:glucose-1-phosphate thymidylyltransferase
MTRRAVILSRGLGTRMRRAAATPGLSGAQAEVASTGVKALIPIGRPFLDYGLSALADAGITDVCLIIGPEHDAVRDYYAGDGRPSRLSIDFAVQLEPRGTADAVLAAEEWTDGDPFLVLNGDNYYPVDALRALASANEPALVAFGRDGLLKDGQIDPTRIASFAVLQLDDDRLRHIVEKPDAAVLSALGPHVYCSMNCWRFDSRIFAACRAVPLSPRGELELPAAVELAMAREGMVVRAIRMDVPVLDLSNQGDIPAVAARLAGTEVRL